ncbi:myosin-1B-like [Lineus longissimus]|uniref:myosin-1B-like n=1 Tax=Lineus longissimus TaxID=88925 RepID=UPI00315C6317
MYELFKGLFRFLVYSQRVSAGDNFIEEPFLFESQMPNRKNNNKQKANNGKSPKSSNTDRPMASKNGNTDISSGPVSADAQSSNSGVAQSPDRQDPSMTEQTANAGLPSNLGNTSTDGRELSGVEFSSLGGDQSLAEQSSNDGPLSDFGILTSNGRQPSRNELASGGEPDLREHGIISLQNRVKTVEDRNKLNANEIKRLKEQLAEQEAETRLLATEVDTLRSSGVDKERARRIYKDEVKILEEVHQDKIQNLKEEHNRAITDMRKQHEMEVHTKDAELIRAKDETIRREAEGTEKERERHKAGMQTIIELFEGLDRKIVERVGLITTGVISAVQTANVHIMRMDGKVDGFEKLVEDKRQEDRENQLDVVNKLEGVVEEVGDVHQTVDFLKQDVRQRHEEMKQSIDMAFAEMGKKIGASMNVMMKNKDDQNEELQQTIRGLHEEITASHLVLLAALQGEDKSIKMLHAIGHLRQQIEDKIEALPQNLRRGDDASMTEAMRNMKQWIENLTFKAEKTNTFSISRP